MNINIGTCPFCNGTEFIEATQSGYAAIAGEGLTSTALNHTVCRRCGSVVRSYVQDPEKLLKKKNRKTYQ